MPAEGLEAIAIPAAQNECQHYEEYDTSQEPHEDVESPREPEAAPPGPGSLSPPCPPGGRPPREPFPHGCPFHGRATVLHYQGTFPVLSRSSPLPLTGGRTLETSSDRTGTTRSAPGTELLSAPHALKKWGYRVMLLRHFAHLGPATGITRLIAARAFPRQTLATPRSSALASWRRKLI